MEQAVFNVTVSAVLLGVIAWMLFEKRIDRLTSERIDNLLQQVERGEEGQQREGERCDADDGLDSGMREGATR